MIIGGPRPSIAEGYARNKGESANGWAWDDLVGAWAPMLGVTGGKLFDQSSFKNHGVLTNMDPATDWVKTPSGECALRFDKAAASQQYVDMPSILPGVSGLRTTVCMWIRIISYDTQGFVIFGTDTGASVWWQVRNDDDVPIHSVILDVSVTNFDDSEWHHLALVSTDSGRECFWDGQSIGSDALSGTALVAGPKNFRIGSWFAGRSWDFDGELALLTFHARPLPLNEIQDLLDPPALFRLKGRTHSVPAVVPPAGAIMNQMQSSNLGADLFNGTLVV